MPNHLRFIIAGMAASLVLVIAVPLVANAVGLPTAFGGTIASIRPCLGSSLVVATIRQPPFMIPIEVSALPSPFLFYMMTHPGQFTLGLLGAPSFCATSPHTGFWAPASFFYGTSAPTPAQQAAPGPNQTAPM